MYPGRVIGTPCGARVNSGLVHKGGDMGSSPPDLFSARARAQRSGTRNRDRREADYEYDYEHDFKRE